MTDLFSRVEETIKEIGDIVILDTRRLELVKIDCPEFDWKSKINLVSKEKLYALLCKICILREQGNITMTIPNYGGGTWWPLKYIRISLQEGGYLIYDRYKKEIDYKSLGVG